MMTRSMGDATHDNVAAIPAGVELVAGYVTGTPDVKWTPLDWARFPGIPHITIDQAAAGSPVTNAIVRDVEPNAWSPLFAVDRANWEAERPTIYCDLYDLTRPAGVLAFGWQGDLWLAIPGWTEGGLLPPAPGCTIVAVQNAQNVNGTYDSSVVLDPTWPEASVSNFDFITGADGAVYLVNGGRMSHIPNPADITAIQNGTPVSAECQAQLLKDFPPGQPSVTVGSITFPTYTSTPSA